MKIDWLSNIQGTVDPHLPWRFLDTHWQVWLSLLWGYSSLLMAPGAHEVLFCALQESVSPVLWKFCNQIPLAPQSNSLGVLSRFAVSPGWEICCRSQNFLNRERIYNCSAVCGQSVRCLYGGANGDLLQEGLSHTLHDPDLVQPEPLSPQQVTADLCLHRRHSNAQRQVWLSLCGVSGS